MYLSNGVHTMEHDENTIELRRNITAIYTEHDSDLDLAVALVAGGNFSTALTVLQSSPVSPVTDLSTDNAGSTIDRTITRLRTLATIYENLSMLADAEKLMLSSMNNSVTANVFTWIDIGKEFPYSLLFFFKT